MSVIPSERCSLSGMSGESKVRIDVGIEYAKEDKQPLSDDLA